MPTDPATVPTLTEQEIGQFRHEYRTTQTSFEAILNAVYALAASRVDTAEVERRAASKALTECAKLARTYSSGLASGPEIEYFSDRYLAREYPAPAPRECVLSDKSVVTRNPSASKFAFTRNYPFGGVVRYRSEDDWRLLADTGADFDALKRFAAEVGQ